MIGNKRENYVVVVVEEEEKDTNLPTRAIANAPQLVALLLGVLKLIS